MGVHHAALEPPQEVPPEDLHEARRDHQVGLVAGDLGRQRPIPGVAVGIVAQPQREGGDAGGLGDLGGPAVAVHPDGHDAGRVVIDGGLQ